MGKKLGLTSKVSDEIMLAQIRQMEKEDRAKARKSEKRTESGAEAGNL